MRQPSHHALQVARVVTYACLVFLFCGGLWLTEHRFDQSLHELCVNGNGGRDDLRRAFSEVLTENLVEVARTPPDPAVVARYKAALLDDLEREFPDKEC